MHWRKAAVSDIYERILLLKKSGKTGVLITVVERSGSVPADPGSKMLVTVQGETFGTVGGGSLENHAIERAKEILATRKSMLQKYSLDIGKTTDDVVSLPMVCGGNVTLFYEFLAATLLVFIFGAGHVGSALARHLSSLGYEPTVVDSRKDILDTVEGALKLPVDSYAVVSEKISVLEGSFIVIATHSHEYDYQVLKSVYTAGWHPRYIGAVASKKKAKEIMDRLYRDVGKDVDTRNLFMPVGLDIGGRSVDEIAVSIVSEMQAVRYGKEVPHLRIEMPVPGS